MSSDPSSSAPASGPVADVPFDRDLFDLLVCPESHAPLKFTGGRLVSTDAATRRAYRVDQGIPVMLIDESQVLSEVDWRAAMAAPGPIGAGVAAVQARHSAPAGG
jgi:uncharacterized protein YbaR (Trm112 family)